MLYQNTVAFRDDDFRRWRSQRHDTLFLSLVAQDLFHTERKAMGPRAADHGADLERLDAHMFARLQLEECAR